MSNRFTKESIKHAQLAATTEASIQAAIIGYLSINQIPYTITEAKRSFNQSGKQVMRVRSGWPDITACYEGFFVGIECKRPVGGRLSLIQAHELELLLRAGGLIVIARSVADVEETLRLKKTSVATMEEITKALKKDIKSESWR